MTSIRLKMARPVLAAVLAVAAMCSSTSVFAQTQQKATARSSVLPTGGGQALLDPSDTVILLLDHQAGLFQTVKDINLAELRSNTPDRKDSDAVEDSCHHDRIRAQRTEWTADAGDPPIRTPRGLRRRARVR